MRSNSDQLEKKLIELLRFPSTSGTLSFEINKMSFEINKIFCYRSVILLNIYSDEVKFRPSLKEK